MQINEAIGHVLRDIRLEQGVNLRQLSKKAYVALSYISEVERGVKEPSSATLRSLCVGLGITEGHLLVEAGYLLQRHEKPYIIPVPTVLAQQAAVR